MSDIVQQPRGTLTTKIVATRASYVPPGRPPYPKGLSPSSRRVFKMICARLEERRTLTTADGELIRLYCVAHERHNNAIEHLEKEGTVVTRTITDAKGTREIEKVNLWYQVADRAETRMCTILVQLGLTPQSRDKVKVTRSSIEGDIVEMKMSITETITTKLTALDVGDPNRDRRKDKIL